MFKVILRFSHIPQHIAIAMAIISPTIRRSLHQVLASSKKSFCKNNNVLSSSSSSSLALGRVTTTRSSSIIISRRAIHSTSVVSGDALDMADTFSRRHRKLYCYISCYMRMSCAHHFYHGACEHHLYVIRIYLSTPLT